MTSKKLLVLSVAAVVAIGAGLWVASWQSSSGSGEAHEALYPALKGQLDSVTAVRLYKPGDVRAVELAKKDSAWVVSERSGYPADQSKLRKLLVGLAEAGLYEQKTSDPQRYATLGVEDTSAADAGGVRIELLGPAQPVNLIVGKPGIGAQSSYVRRAGEVQSWLIDTSPDTSSSPDAWLRKEIVDISADRIQSASVQIQGAKRYTAAKKSRADADFAVEGLPKGKKLSSPSIANSFATALVGLTLTDVQPASAFESAKPAAHATFSTFDGLVTQLDGWTRDDKHFIAVKTSFDAEQAERFKVATEPAEGSPEAKEPVQTKEAKPDVEKDAQSANAKLEGWVYEIPEYKYDAIFKPVEDLL